MRVLRPGVFCWSRFSDPHGYDFNGHLFTTPAASYAIDPVEFDPGLVAELGQAEVGRILITNRNHTRAAERLHRETGADVWIHPLDADHARRQGVGIDETFEWGEEIGPFRVIGVPGKSPGEVALFDAAQRLLVVGDAVIGNPAGQLALLPDRVVDDPKQLRASLRALLELDFDALLVGDGVSIDSGARVALERLVAQFPD
jgi:glyoxylase-like metal-dependent hydrolase (beta-lactamase superfamily II)